MKSPRDRTTTVVQVLLYLAASAALGEELPTEHARLPPAISVSEHASSQSKPDEVRIELGVLTEAKDAASAARENARRSGQVMKALRGALGQSADITTAGYSIEPVYDYPRDGGQPTLTGFRATNIVRVKTADLERVGTIIDSAVAAGGNRVQGIEFSLRDPQAARAAALREAARRARASAEALAAALDQRIVRVLSATESSHVQPFRAPAMAMSREEAATPIEPGTIDIDAQVTLTVEIEPIARGRERR
jgi:uncharacterized protein